jgi:hypothetical protein
MTPAIRVHSVEADPFCHLAPNILNKLNSPECSQVYVGFDAAGQWVVNPRLKFLRRMSNASVIPMARIVRGALPGKPDTDLYVTVQAVSLLFSRPDTYTEHALIEALGISLRKAVRTQKLQRLFKGVEILPCDPV